MASTNKTTNYELSQYIGTDKPTYLGDYNADMLAIDTALKENADDISTVETTANLASTNASTALDNASTAQTTANTASSTATSALNKATTNESTLTTMATGNTFSTSEIKTNKTWIDGKPIYRKVVIHQTSTSVGSTTGVTNYDITHNIEDIDIVVNGRGFLHIDNTNWTPIGNSGVASNGHLWANDINYISTNTIRFRISYATVSAATWYFVIEYTKTTD